MGAPGDRRNVGDYEAIIEALIKKYRRFPSCVKCTGQNASKNSCTTGAARVKIRLQEPAKIWVAIKELELSYYNQETLVLTMSPASGGEKDKGRGLGMSYRC